MSSQAPLTSPALSAFIRGIERRALVVAEFQCGEVLIAERAVAVAMKAFVPAAMDRPMADWPAHFWGLLASTPLLRQPGHDGRWPEDLAHLAILPEGERLALLLRIGGGLDEPTAAAVLGVDVETYQQALALACPRDADGQPDALGWRALAEAVQQRVRDLSELRQEQLDRLRNALVTDEVALVPETPAGFPQWDSTERSRPRAARREKRSAIGQWLWLLTGAMVLAGAGWAWWMSGHTYSEADVPAASDVPGVPLDNPVNAQPLQELPLPSPVEPVAPEPLPEPEQAALLKQADFLAWVAAGAPLPADESGESARTVPRTALGNPAKAG